MSFSDSTRDAVLVACGRHCGICRKFCGIKIELHHIRLKSQGGLDTFDNCIPLCFDCHADMRSYDHKHPKGTKYSETELKQHRDNWYAKVKNSLGVLSSSEYLELDKRVMIELVELLPWDRVILFLRDHDFGAAFTYADIRDLDQFWWKCNDPAFEFIDADLEGIRANLIADINEFAKHLLMNVFPVEGRADDSISVPYNWEETNQQRFEAAVAMLNQSSSKIAECYIDLIRLGKRKLGVLAP